MIGEQLAKIFRDTDHSAAFRWEVLAASSTIASVSVEDALIIRFENGGSLLIADEGQSCCEQRYMTCDDNLALEGGRLQSIDLEAGGDSTDGGYGDAHEQQFLKIRTSEGDLTAVTHNEHNGYYGGFSIKATWIEPDGKTIESH